MIQKQLITLNAPDNVLLAIFDVWRKMGRVSRVKVYSCSMEPCIRRWATVTIEHRLGSVDVGDIIVFKNRDHLTVHRVVEIKQGESGKRVFVTKGDNSAMKDNPVSEDAVVGKVISINNPASDSCSRTSQTRDVQF